MYLFDFLSVALISLLGAISPGPDFAIVTRYALTGSRKAALLASCGVAAGILIHATYCALGVGILIVESPILFRIIQLVGSLYLLYLGICLLLPAKPGKKKIPPSTHQAFLQGFITNILNPKVILFLLGLFTQFTEADTPFWVLFAFGWIVVVVCLTWFCSLSFLMTHPYFKDHFARWQFFLMKGMGLILVLLALSVLSQVVVKI